MDYDELSPGYSGSAQQEVDQLIHMCECVLFEKVSRMPLPEGLYDRFMFEMKTMLYKYGMPLPLNEPTPIRPTYRGIQLVRGLGPDRR